MLFPVISCYFLLFPVISRDAPFSLVADLLPQGLSRGEALRTAGAFSDQRPADIGGSHGNPEAPRGLF